MQKEGLDKERKAFFYKNGKPFFLLTLTLHCGYCQIVHALAMTVKGGGRLTTAPTTLSKQKLQIALYKLLTVIPYRRVLM
jgi:hypothetical protein